jgi:hypothetical protein
MTKKEDPPPPGSPPERPSGPPRTPALQFGPTPTPPGSRLKLGRK